MSDNGKVLVRDAARMGIWVGAFFLMKYLLFKSAKKMIDETLQETEITVKVGKNAVER